MLYISMDTSKELQEFLHKLPKFLYGVCDDAKTVDQAKWLILLEMDFYTDEPASERVNGFIKTKKQYEKAKEIYGGHPK